MGETQTMNTETKKTVLFTNNKEWIVDGSAVDFSAVDEFVIDEACDFYTDRIIAELEECGFNVKMARGQLSLYHGWNGARCFKYKSGICGSYDDLTEEEERQVEVAMQEAEADMYSKFNSYPDWRE